jgi:hypothetical protein
MTRNVLAQARRGGALRVRFQGAVAHEGHSAATVLRADMEQEAGGRRRCGWPGHVDVRRWRDA